MERINLSLGKSRFADRIRAANQPARAMGWDRSKRADQEHHRFAHLSDASVDAMYRNKTATGLRYDKSPGLNRDDCRACRMIKSKVMALPVGDISKASSGKPFETVTVDAIPMKPRSSNGDRINFFYSDPATKTAISDPRKRKSQALNSLKDFNATYVKQHGFTIKRLQTDSEAIFSKDKNYRQYLRDEGIASTFSPPYRQDANGMCERMWYTHKDAAATVMERAKIAGKYWNYVLPAVSETWDRLPLKSTGYTKSPYELRTGTKPDVRHLVPIGAPAYARIYKNEPEWRANRNTLRPKALEGRVIGYPREEQGSYYILLPDGRVKSRYDVVVDHNLDKLGQKDDPATKTAAGTRERNTAADQQAERTPSARIKLGVTPHPRHTTDQVVEEGTGNRGRVKNVGANMADDSTDKPGRIPLPKFVPDAPKNLVEATGSAANLPPKWRLKWTESAAAERKAFEGMITICDKAETRGHKVHLMFDKLKYKTDHETNELIFKTRLVFNGSTQVKGVDFDESYSPTLSTGALLIIIHVATVLAKINWQADIGNAYLQAIDEMVLFILLPAYWLRSDGTRVYARLTGNTYGKRQAGRLWYLTINELLINNGWKRSIHDICVYTKVTKGGLATLGLVVDDTIIFCDIKQEIDDFLIMLRERFPKVTDCAPKVFAGLELAREGDWTTIAQTDYLQKLLQKRDIQQDARVRVPITLDMYERIRAEIRPDAGVSNHFVAAGELRWLDKTRYDIVFALSMISQYQNKSKPVDEEAIKRILQYLQNTRDYKLRLGGRDKEIKLFMMIDASKREDSSMLTWMTFLGRDSGCVKFKCKKNKSAALSSTDAEMRAALEATKDVIWTRGFLAELGQAQKGPTPIYTDSDPCLQIYKSIGHDNATRYMIPVIAFIRQEIENGTVSMHKIKGTHNPADMGTKPLTRSALEIYTKYAMHGLGMRHYNGVDDFVK